MRARSVTGIGIVSSLGVGREAFFEAMRAGALPAEGSHETASWRASGPPVRQPAEVPDFDAAKYLGDKGLRSLDRLTKLLIVAARLGLQDAGLKHDGRGRPGLPTASASSRRMLTARSRRSPSSIASPSWKTPAISTRPVSL